MTIPFIIYSLSQQKRTRAMCLKLKCYIYIKYMFKKIQISEPRFLNIVEHMDQGGFELEGFVVPARRSRVCAK